MNAAQRLEAILNYYGINAKSLSEKCGYGRPLILGEAERYQRTDEQATCVDRIFVRTVNQFAVTQLTFLANDLQDVFKDFIGFHISCFLNIC